MVSYGCSRDDRPSHGRDVRLLFKSRAMDDSGLNQKRGVSETFCEINRPW
jgi:hypothetical protein